MKNLIYVSAVILGWATASCRSGNYASDTPTKKKETTAAGGNAAGMKKPGQAPGGKSSAAGEGLQLALQALDCPDEQRTVPASISVNSSPDEQIFQLTTVCKSQVETEKMASDKYPTDIIFVLDITGSMQSNINSIKNHVVAFARAIEAKGWDARFGAIGFRDSIDARHNFSAASGLASSLGRWAAAGGDDSQEYSQGGLREALKMFDTDKNSKPERLKADKVILLVTDNPGWDPDSGNHANFDTNVAESSIQSAAAVFPRLRFFHSTSQSRAPYAGMSAYEQYNSILTKTGVYGKGLAYPVTESVILSEFVEQFKPVKEQQEMNCRIASMAVKDLSGRTRSDVFTFEAGKDKQVAKITKETIASASLAQLTGERCCSFPGEPESACTKRVPFQIPLRIK